MIPALDQHATSGDFLDQIEQAEQAFEHSFLRVVEVMILEVRALFTEHPEVACMSFEQDGDLGNLPQFSCLDKDGSDLADDIDAVEGISERWNENRHPATVVFLRELGGHTFRRGGFEDDARAACEKLGRELPISQFAHRQWVASFSRHLASMALDQDLPKAQGKKPTARM